ncbi:hypothetical protein ACIGB6_10160 [Paeniglutamicibacter gangotriensis]|uniref:hypothetical protein n=1 Tax=Paeniglutamicibacter gangotriensis TaxID=254787 RepID=UPI0037C7F620
MSATFKSSVSNRTIDVTAASTRSVGLILSDDSSLDIIIAKADAPALALSILEAAGHRPAAYDPERLSGDDLLAYIAHKLAVHVGDEVKRAKEAADREELEGEALELSNAWRASYDIDPLSSWDQVASPGVFVALARKAREIHGAAK